MFSLNRPREVPYTRLLSVDNMKLLKCFLMVAKMLTEEIRFDLLCTNYVNQV